MKHWKKYALCIACVCCVAMLTGCGNGKDSATEKETNAAMTEKKTDDKKDGRKEENKVQTDRIGENAQDGIITDENMADGTVPDGNTTDGAVENGMDAENTGDVNGVTDESNAADGENDIMDNNGDNEKGGSIGDAGRDIVDGVGDAGKDIINGVEEGVDELTGNDTNSGKNG